MIKTNKLSTDIGYESLNHVGEPLCGDHVEVVEPEDGNSVVMVLADGLGSGVKASILATLTSKIISTMTAAGLRLQDCVATVAATLPVCSVRGIAYSTFSVIRIVDNRRAEIIQYDNPRIILLRRGKNYEIPFKSMEIEDKTILRAEMEIQENDLFVALSDGVEHAGVGLQYNFGWQREDIIKYVESIWRPGLTAKTLAALLLNKTDTLYDSRPGDDATVCMVRLRRREPVNLVIGPPSSRDDCRKMMSLFFSKEGKHIVCGGTTSTIAADYLRKPLKPSLNFFDSDIPPTAQLDGADLVTEGVITINRVLEYAEAFIKDSKTRDKWANRRDGASRISQLLFESATDINFYVGKAINPAHQSAELPINFTIKMQLVDSLATCLKTMGKKITVSYF